VTRINNAEAISYWAGLPRELIERFGDEGDSGRQHLLNPAIFRMLGDIRGKRILDAGCGQGYLCRLLAKEGAHATGVEPAAPLIGYAIEREHSENLGIVYIQEDLSAFAFSNAHFDAVVANMVFMDIPDYQQAMRNCVRCLKDYGDLIFSLSHPCFEGTDSEYAENGHLEITEYFEEHSIKQTYGYRFHRPLSQYLNLSIQSGCCLKEIVEPQLDAAFAEQDRKYARNAHVPAFIIIHAMKEPS
jgi:2-polyprenyl-3-methyl-5-hydroxy-6-metoxy-1,4-benzoquinol methylase